MSKILNRRILRDLKENFVRYTALFILITLGVFIISSMFGSAETIIARVGEFSEQCNVEDGQFTVFMPLTEDDKNTLTSKGIAVEENFYLDFSAGQDSTVRIFKSRSSIDLVKLDEGKMPENENEIVLEKLYAKNNKIEIGDEIELADVNYKIVGIGTSPDYDSPLANIYDTGANSDIFGTGFVTAEAYDRLKTSRFPQKSEEYLYSYSLNDSMSHDELKNLLKEKKVSLDGNQAGGSPAGGLETENLTSFVKSEDNPRIGASSDNVLIKKNISTMAGVIVFILIAYVISVFVAHSIEMENKIIGALYALGLSKRRLLCHYIILPLVICLAGGVLGTLLSFTPLGIERQMASQASYYSIAGMEAAFSPFLIIYGCVIPPLIAGLVNFVIINRKLSVPALKLLRNEKKVIAGSRKSIGNMNFIKKFRIRQFLREIKINAVVFFGIIISMLLLMESLTGFSFLSNMIKQNDQDIKYNYMYTYKFPIEEVPGGGTGCFEKAFKKEIYGYDLTVNIMGIDKDNPYFDFDMGKGENLITVSTSVADKYGVKTGDEFTVRDTLDDKEYTFKVGAIVQYSVALYAFMDIDSMRDLFGKSDHYCNVVLSNDKLDIDSDRLFAVTTKDDIKETARIFMDKNMGMFVTVGLGAIIMFFIVMYMMLKTMLDRSESNISLIKIFGYTDKEMRKLYLDPNLFTVVISLLIGIPLAKTLLAKMFPSMLANLAAGADLTFNPILYVLVVAVAALSYFISNSMLVRRLGRVTVAEALKTME